MPSTYHFKEVIGAIVMIMVTLRIMDHIYKTFGESVMSTIAPLFSVLALIIAVTLIVAVVTVIIRFLRYQF